MSEEIKEAIRIAVDAGFRVEYNEGPHEGRGIFKCADGYMIQRSDRGCHEEKDFDDIYRMFEI